MWRFIILAVLGLVIGSRARSERGVVVSSVLFGLLYGGAAVVSGAVAAGPPTPGRVLFLLGLGLVMAAPVYAVAEIWRRLRTRAIGWLRRLMRQWG